MPYAWLKVVVSINPDVLAAVQKRAQQRGVTLGGYFGLLARRDTETNGHSRKNALHLTHELPANALDELKAEAAERNTDVATLCKELLENHAADRRNDRRLLDSLADAGAGRNAHA